MSKPPKSMLGKAFRAVTAPVRNIYDNIAHQIGYDNARKGWDDDSPMSEYPTARHIKDTFKKHTEKYGPLMLLSPLYWTEMVAEMAKGISKNNQSKKLVPEYKYNSFEDDLKNFVPDEKRKQRLLASTAHDTERSLSKSLRTVLGMYWAKAGFKEVIIASSLAAATLYCSKESIDVLAEFSNWGRDFNNFYVGAGDDTGAIKAAIVDALRNAYDLDAYSSTLEVMRRISESVNFDISTFNVESSLNGLRVEPQKLAELVSQIEDNFGNLNLENFAENNNFDALQSMMQSLDFDPRQQQEVLTAIENSIEAKASAIEINSVIQERLPYLAEMDFQHVAELSRIVEALAEQKIYLESSHLQDISKTVIEGANPSEQIQYYMNIIQGNFPQYDMSQLFSKENTENFIQIKQDTDMILAEEILQSSAVKANTNNLLTEIPKQFGSMLGKFIAYVIPAYYTAEHLALRWQMWMTGKLSNEWLKYKSAYQVRFGHTNIDNPDQRIQDNLDGITSFVVDGTTDGMQNALKLATFLPMLGAMGSFNPAFLGGPDITIDNFLTWSALGYAALGTGIMGAIAYNLPQLFRDRQKTSADHRANMVSIHNQPEQIALMKGEKQEKSILRNAYDRVNEVKKRIINKNVQIKTFNTAHVNVGSYVPILLAAPQYFGGIINYGQVTQAAGIFRTVESSFEFFKNMIIPYSSFKAGIDRTAQLVDAFELARYETLEREYYMHEAEKDIAAQKINHNDNDVPPPAHSLDM